MRILPLVLLFAPVALHAQQLGVPMSSLPGVAAGVATAAGNAGAGGVEGISLPAGALNRLLMAPTSVGRTNADVGQEIERAFYGNDGGAQGSAGAFGIQGGAASTINGAAVTRSSATGGVQPSGTSVQLPTSQQLMPANLIPGYQTSRGSAGESPTGVDNVFTGTGVPRSGVAP